MAKSLQIDKDKLKESLDAEQVLKSRIDNVRLLENYFIVYPNTFTFSI